MDKKKTKNKPTVPSAADEQKDSMVGEKEKVVEQRPITPDTIFFEDRIDKLFNAKDPIESINILLQDHFRKINGNANFNEKKSGGGVRGPREKKENGPRRSPQAVEFVFCFRKERVVCHIQYSSGRNSAGISFSTVAIIFAMLNFAPSFPVWLS